MTIRDLKDILIHFQDKQYDDYNVVLWDYNHQQELKWGASFALSHPSKTINFPVDVPPVDGLTVNERFKKLQEETGLTYNLK